MRKGVNVQGCIHLNMRKLYNDIIIIILYSFICVHMSSTRISDLPESGPSMEYSNGPSNSLAKLQSDGSDAGLQNSYMPMNIHPNPYGNAPQPPGISNPFYQPPATQPNMSVAMPNQLSQEQMMMMLQNTPTTRLPSRDIQIDSTDYSQDEQIHPNYIPKIQTTDDYVRSHENVNNIKIEKHEKENHRRKLVDLIFSEIQTPFMIALLYFLFQMPFLNSLLFKRFSFLSIYNADGNFNFQGLLLKSILFGSAFYFMMQSVEYISEI